MSAILSRPQCVNWQKTPPAFLTLQGKPWDVYVENLTENCQYSNVHAKYVQFYKSVPWV